MRRHAPIRLLVCAAMAGSAAFAALAIPGAIAAAAPLTVTCTHLLGNPTSQAVSGCSGTGIVGTTEASATGTQVTSTKTVTWADHKTSKITYTYGNVTPDACVAPAGYSKYLEVTEKAGSKVSGGTATKLIGGAVSGKVCIFKSIAHPTVAADERVQNLGSLHI